MASKIITLTAQPTIADIDAIMIDNLEHFQIRNNSLRILTPFDPSIIKNPEMGFKYTDDQCDKLSDIMAQIRSHLRFETKRIMKNASKTCARVMISGIVDDNYTTITIKIKSNRAKIIY